MGNTIVMENTTKNIEVTKRFIIDGIGKGNTHVFDDSVDSAVIVETGLSPAAPIQGLDNYKNIFSGFADAFPVIKFVIDDIFAVEEKVVVRFSATAIFKKDYYGISATNEIITMKEVHILTFANGKIVSNIVSATNFPFEYLMYPVLRDLVIGNLPRAEN